jgi:hypothetical protein
MSEKMMRYRVVQKSVQLTRFRESADIAYQIMDIYLHVLPLIRITSV